jgi:hypothetical protein
LARFDRRLGPDKVPQLSEHHFWGGWPRLNRCFMITLEGAPSLTLLGRVLLVRDEILTRADYTVAMPWGLKRFQQAGDLHFVTFSCYRRKVKLGTAARREVVERALEQTRR